MISRHILRIQQFLATIARRKWLILGCCLFGATCGLFFYLTQEKVYRGEALLSYKQQKLIPISSDDRSGLGDVLSTITESVLSQSSLEGIIYEEELYTDLRKELSLENVVAVMREDITIIQSANGDTFVIGYEGVEPEKVVRVTDSLAAIFIAENLKYEEERASETYSYIQNELRTVKEKLERKAAEMSDYKLKYYNEMPRQLTINRSRLAALQDQFQARQKSIQELERSKVLVWNQINERKQIIDENQRQSDARKKGEQQPGTSIKIDQRATLEMLENGLAEMLKRYNDQHPMVKRLKEQIVSVERLIEEEEQQKLANGPQEERQEIYDNVLASLQIQLKDIDLNLDELEQEKEEFRVLIKKYEEWIASAPVREAEWSSLKQEYGELKSKYDSLAKQNIQASSLLNPEGKQKGAPLRVEELSRLPLNPVKPDFIKIFFISVIAGILIGGLLALGMEMADASFKNQVEVEQICSLPVICSVPSLPLAEETVKRRFWSTIRISVFLIWFSALCVSLVFLSKEGGIVTPFFQIIR